MAFVVIVAVVSCSQGSETRSTASNTHVTASTSPGVYALADCHEFSCEGPLEPGSYRAMYFDPSIDFEITSPGWAWSYSGSLVLIADPSTPRAGPISPDGIYFLREPSIASRDCEESAEHGLGRSVDDLASALANTPGLATTEPTPVTIGGLDGVQIDLEVDPAWKRTCPFSEGLPAVPLIFRGAEIGGYHWAIVRGQWMRWYILESSDGVMIVDVEDAPNGPSREELLQISDEIVGSMEFSASS